MPTTTPTRARSRAADAAPWWACEEAIRVSDVPAHVPTLPNGRRVSLASVYRWTTAGLHGLRLRRFRVGGVWCTTVNELARWSAALTAAAEAAGAVA